MAIPRIVQEVHNRLLKRYRLSALLWAASFGGCIALLSALLSWISSSLAIVFAGAASLTAVLGCRRFGWYREPAAASAATLVDERFAAKDRLTTLADNERGGEISAAAQQFISAQLSEVIPSNADASALVPMQLTTVERRITSVAAIAWIAALVLIYLSWAAKQDAAAARTQAALVAQLLQQQPDLPQPLKRQLENLEVALSSSELTSSEVGKALERAEQEIQSALDEQKAKSDAEAAEADTSASGEEASSDTGSSKDQKGEAAAGGKDPKDKAASNKEREQEKQQSKTQNEQKPDTQQQSTPTPAPSQQKDAQQQGDKQSSGESSKSEQEKSKEQDARTEQSPENTDVQNSKSSSGSSKDAKESKQASQSGEQGQGQ